jgi:methyltransferase (TIGR00027 family)
MKKDKASSTALLIAASFAFLSRAQPDSSLVPPDSRRLGDWLLWNYSWFTRSVGACLDFRWFRALLHGIEGFALPGIVEHYARRKHAIESLARESGQLRQLVVLGAGFDTLSARLLTEFPDMKAWEIDHPATQAWKIKGMASSQRESPGLAFLPRDFSLPGPLTSDFLGPQYRKELGTFWVAEGFLMYFPVQKVEEFFRFIHQNSAIGSRVAFTFMQPQDDGRVDFRRSSGGIRLWLACRSEPFAWGILQKDLPAFLFRLGFRLLDLSPQITQEVSRLNVGEYLAVAEVSLSET